MDRLEDNQPLLKKSQLQAKCPKMQAGLLVASNRLGNTRPIIPKGNFSYLLVKECHEQQLHLGRQSTAAAVLRRHSVLGLNKTVRSVIRTCARCQRLKAKPYSTVMSNLPLNRCECSAYPFETTGVDYFGPFQLKGTPGKVYGVIFTCAASRALHLEVAIDLSSTGIINALRRFVARRGNVKRIVSDNGTNFIGASKQLRAEVRKQRDADVQAAMRKNDVEWQFNPPGAAHFGGFWERLIQSVRRVLEAQAKHSSELNLDAFHTLLCECEAVLNNRPLTIVSEDARDLEALTPNHILLGCGRGHLQPPATHARLAAALKNQWKSVQHCANQFWKRWSNEYRVLLQDRPKWTEKRRNLCLNDIVLVVEPLRPRAYWKLGRVVGVHLSKDGEVRVVEVRTNVGIVKRPITKICLLETASGIE